MSRNTEQSIISIYNLQQAEWFITDEAGITELKRQIRMRAQEYLYLRKGEDFGAFIQMLFELFSQSPDVIQTVLDSYFRTYDSILKDININKIIALDWSEVLAFYMILTDSKELIFKTKKEIMNVLKFSKKLVKLKDFKILCNPDEINKKAKKGWDLLDCKVINYKKYENAGSHRFYISEKEIYIFIRKSDRSFFWIP